MDRRWLLWLAAVAATAASGCASGDGSPEARVLNRFNSGCIVEASYLGYGFTEPIGASGSMATREVPEGSAKAYAIRMDPPAGGTCYDTVTVEGGELWVTTKPYIAKAGQRTDIIFSDDAAVAVKVEPSCDATNPDYIAGVKLFARLSCP